MSVPSKNTAVPSALQPYLEWIENQKEGMTQSVLQLVETNSYSRNLEGLATVADQLTELFGGLGAPIQSVPLRPGEIIDDAGARTEFELGRALRIIKRPEAPIRVLLVGHMDTVFPPDHPFQKPSLLEDGILRGPGAADLKGGLVVMQATLAAIERSPWAKNLGWEVLINPDEEIGSPGSAPLLAEAAGRNQFGLVYEPALPDGSLVSSRKGTGGFTIAVKGRSAHAGRDFDKGRNAVCALAEIVCHINELNGQREGVTLNPGCVLGGGPINVVPDFALLRFNVRTTRPDDERWVLDRLARILSAQNKKEGIAVDFRGKFSRQPKLIDDRHQSLFQMVARCGRQQAMALAFQPSGGCCDGNNLTAAGLANIDTMGVVGGQIHTEEEYMRLDSLTGRAKLGALLLLSLATGQIEWRPDGPIFPK
jgi:glutamate carboxypeptidase